MTANKSEDPAVKSTLIVAPVALLNQWKLEIEMKTDDSMKCLIYHGQGKAKTKKELMKYDVVLTTFNVSSPQAVIMCFGRDGTNNRDRPWHCNILILKRKKEGILKRRKRRKRMGLLNRMTTMLNLKPGRRRKKNVSP